MKSAHQFPQRTHILFGFVPAAILLIVCGVPKLDASAKTSAAPAADQANGQQQQATDADQQRVFSGPQPGEEIKPFNVVRVKAGQSEELEIVKETDDRITLICFVHQIGNDDRILFGMGLVDFYASRHKQLTSHIVLLSDDREKIISMLRGWERGPVFTKSLVSLSADGAEGPGFYGLNRNVSGMTVLVAKENKVVDNLVFQAPNNRDLQTIMTAVAKALGEPEPTLAEVQQELRAERQRRAEERIKASPIYKLAPSEEPGRIMFRIVNGRGNRSQIAQRGSQQLLDWAGDNKERKTELKKYCQAVLAGDFELDRYSREAIQKLAEN